MINVLTSNLPNATIIGTTTAGEIIECDVKEKEVIISFALFEKSEIRSYAFKGSEVDIANEIDSLIRDNTKAIIMFADGLNTNGEKLLENINSDVVIAGGLAGDNLMFKNTYVFTTEFGDVVAAFIDSDELKVYNDYRLNWEGVGRSFEVTKAEHEKVYELNNIPIKEIYKNYFGELADKYLLELAIEFPLITKRDVEYARAAIGEEEDCLIFAGNLHQGELVKFGYASVYDILINDLDMFKNLNNKGIEVIFIYECISRKKFFDRKITYEYKCICNVKNAGFFTYGEFFNNKFFNQTITILAFSENPDKKVDIIDIQFEKEKDFLVCEGLTNLIKSATRDLEMFNGECKRMAETDYLTQIYNRKGCMDRIQKLNCPYSLILFDIDDFKRINDVYGHDKGDEVLIKLANLVKTHIRKEDIFCRFGGEEFLVILPNTEYDDAIKIAEKLRKLVEKNLEVTISVGVSKHTIEFKETFKDADEKLYIAKKNGKNRVY